LAACIAAPALGKVAAGYALCRQGATNLQPAANPNSALIQVRPTIKCMLSLKFMSQTEEANKTVKIFLIFSQCYDLTDCTIAMQDRTYAHSPS
jgi:hypothetical protein